MKRLAWIVIGVVIIVVLGLTAANFVTRHHEGHTNAAQKVERHHHKGKKHRHGHHGKKHAAQNANTKAGQNPAGE